MRCLMQAVLLGLLVFLGLRSCGGSDQTNEWSQAEKENAAHFIYSSSANIEAISIINEGPAFEKVTEDEIQEILRLQRRALAEARKIRDPVLEKIHEGMAEPFRNKYQRSLELTIKNLEEDNKLMFDKAGQLHDEWIDWYREHYEDIKIPKL